MHSKWVFKHFRPYESKRNLVLILTWCGGLLAGVLLCSHASYNYANIVYGAIHTCPSLPGQLVVCVLPVTVSALAVYLPLFPVAYILVLLSAVTHGFSGMAIFMAVGSAAWIVRPMLLVSSSCAFVLMWWLLLQRDAGSRTYKPVCLALCLSCLIGILYLFFISPFIGDLTKVL